MTRIAKLRGSLTVLLLALVLSVLVVNLSTREASSQTPPTSQFVQQVPTKPFVFEEHVQRLDPNVFFRSAVTSGYRLVIEHVSVHCELGAGEKMTGFFIRLYTNEQNATHHLMLPESAGVANSAFGDPTYDFSASQSLRLYADPATHVVAGISVNATGVPPSSRPRYCLFSLSGYLAEAGAPPE